MRRSVFWLIVFALAPYLLAQEVPERYVSPSEDRSGLRPGVEIIDFPTARFSTNWVFVIDASDSMAGVFHRALEGWRTVTQHSTDEWRFCVFAFSDRGRTRYLDWRPATPEDFATAEVWVERPAQQGVNSRVREALEQALRLGTRTLSVVIISDGGFTEACENRGFGSVRSIIAEGQGWRRANGLSRASITTIGINNPHYSAWCRRCILDSRTSLPHDYSIADSWVSNIGKKPSNPDCQDFLQEIGTRYGGGYLLVRAGPTAPSSGALAGPARR